MTVFNDAQEADALADARDAIEREAAEALARIDADAGTARFDAVYRLLVDRRRVACQECDPARGHTCTYHLGWADGVEHGLRLGLQTGRAVRT